MKYLLVILISFIIGTELGDILKANNIHQQIIGKPKSVNVSKIRYFFIGYCIGGKADGNIEWRIDDGGTPKKKEVYEFVKRSYPEIDFNYNEFIIVGLHEFKNKAESDQFYKDHKSK